jgi:hypothetical protein
MRREQRRREAARPPLELGVVGRREGAPLGVEVLGVAGVDAVRLRTTPGCEFAAPPSPRMMTATALPPVVTRSPEASCVMMVNWASAPTTAMLAAGPVAYVPFGVALSAGPL